MRDTGLLHIAGEHVTLCKHTETQLGVAYYKQRVSSLLLVTYHGTTVSPRTCTEVWPRCFMEFLPSTRLWVKFPVATKMRRGGEGGGGEEEEKEEQRKSMQNNFHSTIVHNNKKN